MAQLFGVQVPAISKHLKNIYAEGELLESTTISKMETVVQRGFRGGVEEMVDFYNLDAIISVGYRVNSAKATQFRIWATNVLKEYMIKGFVLDSKYSSPDRYELYASTRLSGRNVYSWRVLTNAEICGVFSIPQCRGRGKKHLPEIQESCQTSI